MMECVNSAGVRCSGSVVSNRCVELLDERRICGDLKQSVLGCQDESGREEERIKMHKDSLNEGKKTIRKTDKMTQAEQ